MRRAVNVFAAAVVAAGAGILFNAAPLRALLERPFDEERRIFCCSASDGTAECCYVVGCRIDAGGCYIHR